VGWTWGGAAVVGGGWVGCGCVGAAVGAAAVGVLATATAPGVEVAGCGTCVRSVAPVFELPQATSGSRLSAARMTKMRVGKSTS